MPIKYLNNEGLSIFWQKIKDYVDKHDFKLNYTTTGRNYKVSSDEDNNLYVNVPWTDTNYTLNSFGVTATADELNKLDGCIVATTEINYLDGVTSNVQTQLNEKANSSHAHNLSDISDLNDSWDILLKTIPSGYVTRWPSWSEVTGKPNSFTPSSHNHDDRYYTEEEINSKLDEKANASHGNHVPTYSTSNNNQVLKVINGIPTWSNDNNTTYSQATSSSLGLVKIGYAENGRNYPIELNSSGQMFVNVPWTDNNTTYGLVGAQNTTGLVKNGSSVTSSSGYTACPIIGGIPYYKDTNTTYSLGSFGITATAAELNYCDGVTSNIQTQLNGKAASSHSHTGLDSLSNVKTISKTLTVGTSWMDTGIEMNDIGASGSYVVQISGMNSDATSMWNEIFTGFMSVYNGTTNSTESDEIILHKCGHAANGRHLYLRIIRVSGSTGYAKLQIAASTSLSSSNYTFKFKKLI